ncbi:MAG: hypothetical protein M3P18_02285 [Actinomycetota bacterium]|nr:hypothetical protein [Actinomycetota bacterium]
MNATDSTAERQPRERSVGCQSCRRQTWNVTALCDDCEPSALAYTALREQGYSAVQAGTIVGKLTAGGAR